MVNISLGIVKCVKFSWEKVLIFFLCYVLCNSFFVFKCKKFLENFNNIWYFCKYFIMKTIFNLDIFIMQEKQKIDNKIFDILAIFISFILSFFRSFQLFFTNKNSMKKKNIFFQSLDFIFSTWPKYFWKKPSLYKLFSFPGDLISYIFRKK